jgi:hypothetical protein
MSYEQQDPRLLKEVGDLTFAMFTNQIGLRFIS